MSNKAETPYGQLIKYGFIEKFTEEDFIFPDNTEIDEPVFMPPEIDFCVIGESHIFLNLIEILLFKNMLCPS